MSDDRDGTDADGTGSETASGEEATEPTDDPDPLAAATADAAHVRATVGERAPHVATVTIDRPEARNALNETVRAETLAAFEAVDDSRARVVVVTGDDEAGAFVAGADVTELRERSAVEQRAASEPPRVYEAVATAPVPVIARINGHALGGGCELAQACDVRIASERAKLGQPEIGLGLIPGGGATQRLPRLVGSGQAARLILSGELIDADEAADIGLVEACVAHEQLDERVNELAERIASHSPLAVRRAIEAVRAAERKPLSDGIEFERELFVGLFDSHDTNEGIDAFLEDRDPEWRGE